MLLDLKLNILEKVVRLADDPKAAVTMGMPTIDRNDELYIALNVDRVRVLMNSEKLERLPETLYKWPDAPRLPRR